MLFIIILSVFCLSMRQLQKREYNNQPNKNTYLFCALLSLKYTKLCMKIHRRLCLKTKPPVCCCQKHHIGG